MPFMQAHAVRPHQHEPDLVDATAAGAAEHLQNFVRPQRLLDVVALVSRRRQRNAAQAEVNAAARPIVATTARSWPAFANGSMTPARAA